MRRIATSALGWAALLCFAGYATLADEPKVGDWLERYMLEPPTLQTDEGPTLEPWADPATLWRRIDPTLQADLEDAVARVGLAEAAREYRLGVALVDVSALDEPRAAEVNGDLMLYAASLPKIAILLAAFEKAEIGELTLDVPTLEMLQQMIQRSSNPAATEAMEAVGRRFLVRVLLSRRYRLYDPEHNGGLWVGKDYAPSAAWQRDPLHELSHGATAMQAARFYYLLQTGRLVNPEASRRMKAILSYSSMNHKFVRGLLELDPATRLYRKSGTWGEYHSDSALIERDGKRYVAVGLLRGAEGSAALERLIVALDGLITRPKAAPPRAALPRGAPPR